MTADLLLQYDGDALFYLQCACSEGAEQRDWAIRYLAHKGYVVEITGANNVTCRGDSHETLADAIMGALKLAGLVSHKE